MIRAYWGTMLSVDDSVGRLYARSKDRAARQHALRLHRRQRPAQRRARHGGQADDARAEHPRAAGGALPGADARRPRRSKQQVLTLDLPRSSSCAARRRWRKSTAVVGDARARAAIPPGARAGSTSTTTRSSSPTRRTSAASAPRVEVHPLPARRRRPRPAPGRALRPRNDPEETKNLINAPDATPAR